MDLCVSSSTIFLSIFGGFGRNEIVNFSAKAGAFLRCVFHCGPLLILPRRSSIRYTQSSIWKCNISHSHLSCQGPSVLLVQLILFCPIQAVNFPPSLLWLEPYLILFLISFERIPLEAHVDAPPFTGSFSSLPKVSCFLTSTVNYFLTLPYLSLTSVVWGVVRPIGIPSIWYWYTFE